MKQQFALLMLTLLFCLRTTSVFACETRHVAPTANLNAAAEFRSAPTSPANWTELSTAAEVETTVDIYDGLGGTHTVRLFFFHDDSTTPLTWTVTGYIDGEEVGQGTGVPLLIAQ